LNLIRVMPAKGQDAIMRASIVESVFLESPYRPNSVAAAGKAGVRSGR